MQYPCNPSRKSPRQYIDQSATTSFKNLFIHQSSCPSRLHNIRVVETEDMKMHVNAVGCV
jgi:hypothetical protein